MRQLVLTKQSIDSEQELNNIVQLVQGLQNKYNVALCIVEQEGNNALIGVPIFDGRYLMEFHDIAVALDIESTNLVVKSPAKNKYFLEISQEYGRPALDPIDIDEFLKELEIDG